MKTAAVRDTKTPNTSAKATHSKPTNYARSTNSSSTQQSEVRSIISPLPVQRKVVIGPAGDKYEREADAVADKVVAGQSTSPISLIASSGIDRPVQPERDDKNLVQRNSEDEEEEPVQAMLVQRESSEEEDEELVQGRDKGASNSNQSEMGSAASNAINNKGVGSPIIPSTRRKIESSMGMDLKPIRVHEDANAHQASKAMNARAFTHGNDIWLGSGESQNDVHLMAHESTHVFQQDGVVRRAPLVEDEELETEVENSASTTESAESVDEDTNSTTDDSEAPAAGENDFATLLLPEAPSELSEDAQGRLHGAQRNARRAANAEEEMPAANENVSSARGAVTEPVEETAARVQADIVAVLGNEVAPSPEIEELCQRIYEVIRSKRPPDEDSLIDADPEAMGREAGDEMNTSVEGATNDVGANYDGLDNPPVGSAELTSEEMTLPPDSVETPTIGASNAVPDPVTNISLEDDVAQNQMRVEQSGMSGDVAATIQDPNNPVVQARDAQNELESMAGPAPEEVIAQQEESRAQAAADMAGLQAQALAALNNSRRETLAGNTDRQRNMVGSEEQMRTQISEEARGIFTEAQSQVNVLLEPLTRTAMERWNAGVPILSSQFERKLQRVADWIEERHSGVSGFLTGAVDYFTGLPGWVTVEYNSAEQEFGDGVCTLIRTISTEVNRVVALCEALIADADQRIASLFSNLPDELTAWAETERVGFSEQLSGLSNQVRQTRNNFNEELSNRASQAVQEVRSQVHELRQAAGGLVGRIADAIDRFVDDPAKFIIDGILSILGISPAAFWAVIDRIRDAISDIADDPMQFANNMMSAIGNGFQQFFDHILDHLLGGFIEWLFSGLGSVGVTIPSDMSLKSIITFCLELMGITWPRIRRLLATHIGEENVAMIESAYELISDLIEMGPEGIFEMIKDQLDPQSILDQVIDAAIEFMVEAMIKVVTARVILLFNPVGAIAQAVEAIYRVLKWIFENAARIFSLIETVVNGITDIIAGNLSGMANAVETSLAGLISPVIDFLAGYAGMDDLPDKIADVIRGFQEWIEGILDSVIGWLADRAKAVLRSLGLGGEDEEPGEFDGQIGKVVTWQADGESHRMWIVKEGNNAVVKMASVEKPVAQTLIEYNNMADGVGEPQKTQAKEKVGQAEGVLSTLDSNSDQLAVLTSNSEQDPQAILTLDNVIESEQKQLRALLRDIRELLGISNLDAAKDMFGNRLFAEPELAEELNISSSEASQNINDWKSHGELHDLPPRGSREPSNPAAVTLYSFSASKTQRSRYSRRRSYYGYRNPSKRSSVGIEILSKGLANVQSPASAGMSRSSVNFHTKHALYNSERPGSGYKETGANGAFKFGSAILGHDDGHEFEGASGHWSLYGHKQPKSSNRAWNKNPNSYWGPEHRIESAGSGGRAPLYRIPAKYYGTHESWL